MKSSNLGVNWMAVTKPGANSVRRSSLAQSSFLVRPAGYRCDDSRPMTVTLRHSPSAGPSRRRSVVPRVLAVLALSLIMRGSAAAQSSYYDEKTQAPQTAKYKPRPYKNSEPAACFGHPIDLATGAFHIEEQLATIPGRVPIVVGWQFTSQDRSNGPLGQGTSLSTDYFIVAPGGFQFFAAQLVGPKNTHFRFWSDFQGGSGDLFDLTDPPMMGAVLRFNFPGSLQEPSYDLSGTLRFKSGDKYFFDAAGALVRIEDRHGNFVTITRNAQGYPIQVSQPSGRGATFAYNPEGRLASVTLPLGRVWQFAYDPLDPLGRLSRVTDPTGAHSDYTWNPDRLPNFPGLFPATVRSVTDRGGAVRVTNDYDILDRLISQTYPDGGILTAHYNHCLRCYSESFGCGYPFGLEEWRLFSECYTGVGVELDADCGPIPGSGLCPDMDDDNDIDLRDVADFMRRFNEDFDSGPGSDGSTVVTDPRGNVTTKEYTWTSLMNGYDVGRETDALGRTTSFERTSIQRPFGSARLITGIVDFLGRRTDLTWDESGNMLSVTRPTAAGGTATWSAIYDATWNKPISITDELSRTTLFTINALSGDVTGVTDPAGNTTRFAYAANGDLLSMTTPPPLNQTTTFSYTADGDLQRITDPLGRTTEFTYDAASRRIAVRDANLKTVQFAYDPLDRVTSVTQTLSGTPLVTTFQYDAEGNLLRLTDPKGNAWRWTYDAMDRVIEAKNPLLQSAFYTWDLNGNLLRWTDRLNQKGEYTYDAFNRRTSATFRRADGGIESTLALGYNPTTRLLQSMTDSQFGAYSWTYDSIDRIISENGPHGSLSFTLDLLGRRTGLQVSGQAAIAYGYDAAGNLSSMTQGAGAYSFSYDPLNRLTQRQLPNGVSTDWSLDAAGFVSSILSRRGGTTVDSHVYTRDPVGQITGENANAELRSYGYDDLYRLISASVGATNHSWTYDLAGNRLTETVAGATTTYAYNADNRPTMVGAVPVTHDANGHLVFDGTRTHTWDVRGRLAGVSAPGSNNQFTYDPFGLRTAKVVNGVATAYLLDGQDVVSEISGGNSIHTLHGPMVDQPLSRAGLYFTPDHLGSTTTLTDGAGSVVQQYRYSPFGETSRSTTVNNPFQFTGREKDETGLYYYRARHYSPKWGRFVSQDPIGFAGGDANLYAYVANDPVNFTDPPGLQKCPLVFDEKKFAEDAAKRVAEKTAKEAAKRKDIKALKEHDASKEYRDANKPSKEGEKGAKKLGDAFHNAGDGINQGLNPGGVY